MAQPKPPNPGSPEATQQGCTCPVLDNAHGAGWLCSTSWLRSNGLFMVRADCPLHGTEARAKRENQHAG